MTIMRLYKCPYRNVLLTRTVIHRFKFHQQPCFSKPSEITTLTFTYASLICQKIIQTYIVCLYNKITACSAKNECVHYAESRSCRPIYIREKKPHNYHEIASLCILEFSSTL